MGSVPETVKNFEASGIVYDSSRDVYWVVFDSLYALGMLSSDLSRNGENALIQSAQNGVIKESGFEGITFDPQTDSIYVVAESVEFTNNDGETVYHPVITTINYEDGDTYQETNVCISDFEAPSDNKGFESLNLIVIDDQKYFVGLCEGNHCDAGKKGKDSGNGRIILIEFEPVNISKSYQYLNDVGIDCMYKSIETYKLPKYIDFVDYSAMQFRKTKNKNNKFDVVVVSQESSAIWVGKVEWSLNNGPDFDDGKIYEFPKGGNCETMFCNVEGVAFDDNNQFVMVSDATKHKGKQPWICSEKDQSVHIFKLP